MFDIGWSELLLVLVVALVVVGPKDLPRLMRTVGRWVGKARAMADQFRSSFDEMARESELDELRAEIQALRGHNPLTQVEEEINRSILPPDVAPAQISGEPDAGPEAPAGESSKGAAPAGEEAPDIHAEPVQDTPETHKAPLPPGSDPPAP